MPTTMYVAKDKIKLYKEKSCTTKKIELIWGDSVFLQEELGNKTTVKVKARGVPGYVKTAEINTTALLEYYFIDVGQGDGVLIVTPDRKHIMIDGGYIRSKQLTKRNAADFVDWKFAKDYGKTKISLDVMMTSHNDEDHYGGLWDLLNKAEVKELEIMNIEVKEFYYAGINWMEKNGKRGLGPTDTNNDFWTLIPDTKTQLVKLLKPNNTGYELQGQWKQFMQCVTDATNTCERLSNIRNSNGYVPGFQPANGKVSIKVLGPIEEKLNSKPVLRKFKNGDAQNTNGHSLLLRFDYGKTRILLTGDLNAQSQQHILDYYKTNNSLQELSSDITKACHHGSDDTSFEFLSHINAGVTIISSGDNEGHNHPRPTVVAASALTGFKVIKDDKVVTPKIYSTEISRSYKISHPDRLFIGKGGEEKKLTPSTKDVVMEFGSGTDKKRRRLWSSLVVTGMIYGLVNVRTDGNKILCATKSEVGNGWDIETFNSRF